MNFNSFLIKFYKKIIDFLLSEYPPPAKFRPFCAFLQKVPICVKFSVYYIKNHFTQISFKIAQIKYCTFVQIDKQTRCRVISVGCVAEISPNKTQRKRYREGNKKPERSKISRQRTSKPKQYKGNESG